MTLSTERKNKSYSPELKLDAVTRVAAGESVLTVAKHFGVVDPDYIYEWIEKYKMFGEVGLKRKKRKRPIDEQDAVIKELEMENEIVKKYLQILHKEGKSSNLK
jgi:transposase